MMKAKIKKSMRSKRLIVNEPTLKEESRDNKNEIYMVAI